jgi:CRISPR/Cas system CMR-associated protein Cmr3 (group 5 of RAMP superfamily)
VVKRSEEAQFISWYEHQINTLRKDIEKIEKKMELGMTLLTPEDLDGKRSQLRVYEIRLNDLRTGQE